MRFSHHDCPQACGVEMETRESPVVFLLGLALLTGSLISRVVSSPSALRTLLHFVACYALGVAAPGLAPAINA
jgi:hypothetical protein